MSFSGPFTNLIQNLHLPQLPRCSVHETYKAQVQKELSMPGEPWADTAVAKRSLRRAQHHSPQSGAAADRPRPPCRPERGAWWPRPAGSGRLGQQPASGAGSRDRWWTPLLTPEGPDLQNETHFLRPHHNTQRRGSHSSSVSYLASHKQCQ